MSSGRANVKSARRAVLTGSVAAWFLLIVLTGACAPAPSAPTSTTADAGLPQRGFVGEQLRLDASGSEGALRYHWDFGDGTRTSTEDSEVTHTWDEPGHYSLVLEVEGDQGRRDSTNLRVDILRLQDGVTPRRSGRIGLDASGLVYVAMPDFDQVVVLDPDSSSPFRHLDVCDQPLALDVREELLAVACGRGEEVQLWDLGSEALLTTVLLPYGTESRGVLFAPSEGQEGAIDFEVLGWGRWLLAGFRFDRAQGTIQERWTVSGLPGTPEDIGVGEPGGFANLGEFRAITSHRARADGGRAWLTRVPTDDSPPSLVEFRLPLAATIDSDTENRGVANLLGAPSFSPDGQQLGLPGLVANNQAGLYRDGIPLSHETSARAQLQVIGLGEIRVQGLSTGKDDLAALTRTKQLDDRDQIKALDYSPGGDWIFAVMWGTQTLDVLDAYTLEAVDSYQYLGEGLAGLRLSEDGCEAYVLAELTRELVVVPLRSELTGEPFGATSCGADRSTRRVDLVDAEGEVVEPALLSGKRLFHAAWDSRMSRDGYLSCGSCHPDGGHDGRTWDFTDRGEGLRNTPALLGSGLPEYGPLHWSGNFDEIQDFEGVIRGTMAGRGFLSDEDWEESGAALGPLKAGRSQELDDLAEYIASLTSSKRSPFRGADGGLSDEAEAGRLLFESVEVGCVDCHPAPSYTDSQWLAFGEPLLHDVGTLGPGSGSRVSGELLGIDTPTLRSVWASGPYLHDGSVESLEELLGTGGHPDPESGGLGLTTSELQQLVAFLRSIE